MAKFCTKCGRQLADNEVCGCTMQQPQYQQPYQQQYQQPQADWQEAQFNQQSQSTRESEWINEKTTQFMNGTQNLLNEIIPLFKQPISRTRDLAMGNCGSIGRNLIIVKGIVFVIALLIYIESTFSALQISKKYVEIPYAKLIVVVLLFTVGIDFLEALLMKVFTGIFKGEHNFTTSMISVGTRTLFDSSVGLISAIVSLISFKVAIYIVALTYMPIHIIQFGGYFVTAKNTPDRKVYAFCVVKICVMIVCWVILELLMKDTLQKFTNLMM